MQTVLQHIDNASTTVGAHYIQGIQTINPTYLTTKAAQMLETLEARLAARSEAFFPELHPAFATGPRSLPPHLRSAKHNSSATIHRSSSSKLPEKASSGINRGEKLPSRTEPKNLQEQLALQEAKSGVGEAMTKMKIKDPNYPYERWQKMQHQHINSDGSKVNIHYWKNKETGQTHGFKFKDIEN